MQRKFLVPLFFSLTPLIFLTGVTDSFYLPKFIWIFLAVVLLFWVVLKDSLFSYRNTFILPAALLLIWYIITLSRCVNIFEGLHSIFILILFLTLYISLENLVAMDDFLIDEFIRAIIIITVLVCLYGLLQVAGIDFVKWEVRNSPLSTLGRRNFAAEYLVMVIPYMYYLLIDKKKWLLLVPIILSVVHLTLTFTRASYIAFLISGVVFFVLAGKRVNVKVAVIVLLSFLVFNQPLFSGIKTFERGTVKSRMLIWNITFKMIKKNPIMGVGPGNFIITYPYYATGEAEALRGASLLVDSVHNDYLEVCAEAGIVGFVLFLYLLFSVFRASFVLYRGSGRKEKLLIAGIISSMVAICVNGLASFPFKNPATLLLFWADVSFIGGIYRKRVGEKKIGVSYSLLKCYLLIFAVTGLILSYMCLQASRYIYLARNTQDKASLQFAEKSTMYNPFSYKYLHFAGTVAMNTGEYQKAYTLLKKGVKLNPYYDSLHNNLGMIYLLTGNIEKAEEEFLRALQLNPDSYEFNNNAGFLYLTTKRYDEAIKYLKKATQLKPDAYLSFYSLGLTYYMEKQYKEAEGQFKRVLEINPSFIPAKEYLKKISN